MKISPTKEALNVIAALRPPSAKPLRLVYGFTPEGTANYGITVEFETGEPVLATGSGTITRITKAVGKFRHSAGALSTPSYELTINHGDGVVTVIKGLASVVNIIGGYVSRGNVVGATMTQELFIGISYNDEWLDPVQMNRHFRIQGANVPAQAGKMRFAPDTIVRNFAGTVYSTLWAGLRYFVNQSTGFEPLLVNIDFNGNGTKTGLAATGSNSADYWNVFTPGAFTWVTGVYYYECCANACGGTPKVFNKSPQTWLLDSTQKKSAIWLERIAPANADAGTLAAWDEVISSWIGGYTGLVPDENFFAIRGLVAGTYELYLCSNTIGRTPATDTVFYASVNNDAPVSKTTSQTASSTWVEDGNYVKFSLVVPAQGVINIKCYGYFDALQIKRTA
jgi:hypothetical protein